MKDFDIFIQEDGSVSDEVDSFLQQEFEKGKIKYIGRRKENKGLAFSLNELLEIVLKGNYSYIARMDADDICLPERLEKQFAFMEENKEIDVCGTYIEEFSEDMNYRKIVRYPLEHEELLRFFYKRVPIAHMTAFFRRSFFEKAGVYELHTLSNEDTILWLKGFKSGCRFANIPIIGVKVRVNENFFKRRGGLRKVISDFKDRIRVIEELNFPKISYLYAISYLFVQLLPPKMKKYAYKYMR